MPTHPGCARTSRIPSAQKNPPCSDAGEALRYRWVRETASPREMRWLALDVGSPPGGYFVSSLSSRPFAPLPLSCEPPLPPFPPFLVAMSISVSDVVGADALLTQESRSRRVLAAGGQNGGQGQC